MKMAPTGEWMMRRAMMMPTRKQIATKVYIDRPPPTFHVEKPRLKLGLGTPEMPFSPPVKAAIGEFSTKKNVSAIATVIMAK